MEDQIPLPPAPSLGDTITDVFTSPSETFTDIHKKASSPSLWVVPLLVGFLVIAIMFIVMESNEVLKSQSQEMTQQRLEQRLSNGKMTQEQYDQQMAGIEKGGIVILIVKIVITIIVISIGFFLAGLVLWLVNKFLLKSSAGFEKNLEIYGITGWIGVLGGIISIMTMVGLGSVYAQTNLAIFIYSSFDWRNTSHNILTLIDFFGIWQTAILGLGFSKLNEKGLGINMIVIFVLWIISLSIKYVLMNLF
jgi:hypothetical protein